MFGATPITSNQSTDTLFLTAINIITNKYGFNIENIDLVNRIIDLNGPEEKKELCMNEIITVLNEYLV